MFSSGKTEHAVLGANPYLQGSTSQVCKRDFWSWQQWREKKRLHCSKKHK